MERDEPVMNNERIHQTGNWWPLSAEFRDDLPVAGETFTQLRQRHSVGGVRMEADAWICDDDWEVLAAAEDGVVLVTGEGDVLASKGDGRGEKLEATVGSFVLRYPWDLLAVNEQMIGSLAKNRIQGEVSSAATIDGMIRIGEGTRILAGVYIEGSVVIGQNCKIGPNSYIRGNTSIGDGAHIGHAVEIKNSIIGHETSVGHLSYVGDSILGNRVNLGAGTTTANFRHDGEKHRTMVDGRLVDTGRRKFGTIVGNGVHTGIQTAIYPGRKLGAGVTTRPNDTVQRDLMRVD